MTTITDLRARRDALAAQRTSGVARVSYDGKTVDYRSVTEIDRAIEAPEAKINVEFPALLKMLVFKNIEHNCRCTQLLSNQQAPLHRIQ